MKKTIILTESLTAACMPYLETLIRTETDHEFCFFKYSLSAARESGLENAYEEVIALLKRSGKNCRTLEAAGIEEYFFDNRHSREDLYLSPVSYTHIIATTAAGCGYTGNVYIYGNSPYMPQWTNIKFAISRNKYKKTAGKNALDKRRITFNVKAGDTYSYTYNGTRHIGTVPDEQFLNAGAEGITFICRKNSDLRVKLFTIPKSHADLEKLRQMVEYPYKNNHVALPLSLVYDKDNRIMGYVMRNIENAHTLLLENITEYPRRLEYIRDVLSSLVWLQEHSFLHMDFDHNILINDNGAFIIDVDSAQFGLYPSTAISIDAPDGLPAIHECGKKGLYKSAVPNSYTGLMFTTAAVCQDIYLLFGRWSSTGFCPMDKHLLAKIEKDCPDIATMLKQAHVQGKPVSLIRQLEVINSLISAKETSRLKTKISDYGKTEKHQPGPTEYIVQPEPEIEPITGCDTYKKDKLFETKSAHFYSKEPRTVAKKIYSNSNYVIPETHRETPKRSYMETETHGAAQRKIDLPPTLKQYLLDHYMAGTKPENLTTDELWELFVAKKEWKAPLAEAVISTIAIIAMTIFIMI